jgi:hypothetical protein
MTKLAWDGPGERFFEMGVDRGVLYVQSNNGKAWSGLISVSESPSGGEAKPYYFEGQKYLNVSANEEYAATITSFYPPEEFLTCDGVVKLQNGLLVPHQPRKPFGLSYRTRIGNDVSGTDLGYKIHLVYNALAAPSSRPNETMGSSADPSNFSWAITTRPPAITGYRPTAHLVVDTRYTDPEVLAELEELLYGTEESFATIPTPDELIAILVP